MQQQQLQIICTVYHISREWYADVPRQRLIELAKKYWNGFREESIDESTECFATLRDIMRNDCHELDRVKFFRKPDEMKICEFVTERVGITLNMLDSIKLVSENVF